MRWHYVLSCVHWFFFALVLLRRICMIWKPPSFSIMPARRSVYVHVRKNNELVVYIDRFVFCNTHLMYRRFFCGLCIYNQIDGFFSFSLLIFCQWCIQTSTSHAINIPNGCILAINIRCFFFQIFQYDSFVFARQYFVIVNPFDTNDTRMRSEEREKKTKNFPL